MKYVYEVILKTLGNTTNISIITYLLFSGIIFFCVKPAAFTQNTNKQDTLIAGDSVINQDITRNFKFGLIPGLSQYKHEQYWKVPLYPLGIGGLITAGIYQNNQIRQYRNQSEQLLIANFPHSYQNLLDNSKFEHNINQINQNRLKRNLFFAGAGLLYCLNLADAIRPVHQKYHIPYKAGLYSALIPGLGQAYNKDYWKIPLIYAGFATFAYFIRYNHKQYLKYKRAYLIRYYYQGNEEMLPYVDNKIAKMDWISNRRLKREKDRWKRYRDLNIIGISAFYALNIIDALVFAYLYDYNVSDDLSMKVHPAYMTCNGMRHIGITCNIDF